MIADDQLTADDLYNAACSWTLSNNIDSSFSLLFNVANNYRFSNITHLINDKDLLNLHRYNRWGKLLKIVKKNKRLKDSILNTPLAKKLITVYRRDQFYRNRVDSILSKHEKNSKQAKYFFAKWDEADSLNFAIVKKVIKNHGWLGPNKVGEKGSLALFLVIQHASPQIHRKYLPILKEALKNKTLSPEDFALFKDRLALENGNKQVYGTQVQKNVRTGKYEVCPLIDPKNVNKRRESVGLGPIQPYLKLWDIKWPVDSLTSQ